MSTSSFSSIQRSIISKEGFRNGSRTSLAPSFQESFRDPSKTSLAPSFQESFRDPSKTSLDPSFRESSKYGSRTSLAPSFLSYKTSIVPGDSYWAVTKWGVDYNNKNYIRSLTNKHKGLHRLVPNDDDRNFKVEYNNKYYIKSAVNSHRGFHRKGEEIPRKYVPEDDHLGDSSGWEFEYGPEFKQVEEDVPYIPEGKIVVRGQYRFHGTIRNSNDYDATEEEEGDDDIENYNQEEFKYGIAFFQPDTPFHVETKTSHDDKITMGGFRYIDVDRSALDSESITDLSNPAERQRRLQHIDLRYRDTLRSELDLYDGDSTSSSDAKRKGKPFKQTVLKRTYHFDDAPTTDSEADIKEKRYRTEVSLTPGFSGEVIVHKGIPKSVTSIRSVTSIPSFEAKKHPSIRRIFQPKSTSKPKIHPSSSTEYETQKKLHKLHEAHNEFNRAHEDRKTEHSDRAHHAEDDFNRSREAHHEFNRSHEAHNESNRSHKTRKELNRSHEAENEFNSAHEAWKTVEIKETYIVPRRKKSKALDKERFHSAKKAWKQLMREHSPEIERMEAIRKSKRKGTPASDYTNSYHLKDHSHEKVHHEDTKKPKKHMHNVPDYSDYDQSPVGEYDSLPSGNRPKWDRIREEHKFKSKPLRFERVVEQRLNPDFEETPVIRTHKIVVEPRSAHGEAKLKRRHSKTPTDIFQSHEILHPKIAKERRHRFEPALRRIHSREIPPHVLHKFEERENGSFEDDDILMAHRNHPHDQGHSSTNIFEKYIGEDGSEMWVKTKEKITEIHHVQEK